jgi:hypothetical protein
MPERQVELRRRRSRKKKMFKLKDRLAKAKTGHDRDLILAKIKVLSPWWQEPPATT